MRPLFARLASSSISATRWKIELAAAAMHSELGLWVGVGVGAAVMDGTGAVTWYRCWACSLGIRAGRIEHGGRGGRWAHRWGPASTRACRRPRKGRRGRRCGRHGERCRPPKRCGGRVRTAGTEILPVLPVRQIPNLVAPGGGGTVGNGGANRREVVVDHGNQLLQRAGLIAA